MLAVDNTAGRLLQVVSRGRHQKPQVAKAPKAPKALKDIAPDGLEVEEVHKGHRWGVLRCTVWRTELDIWSTPTDPDVTGKLIRRFDARHRDCT